jgi:tetratricopeptide (TPR) repeat protein
MPLAEEFRRLGRHREAVAVLESALRSQPNHTAAQVALGRCLLECERPDKATEVLQDVLRRDPTQLVANRLLIDALIQRRDAAGARRQLEVYEGLNRRDPAVAELRVKIERVATGVAAQSLFERTPEEPTTLDLTELLPAARQRSSRGAAPGPVRIASLETATPPGEPFPQLLGPRAWATYLRGLIDGWRTLWLSRNEEVAVAPVAHADAPSAPAAVVFAGLDETPPPPLLSDLLETPKRGRETPVETAPAPSPPPEVSATLGELYLRQGHAEDAAKIFQQLLERAPGDEAAAGGLRSALRERSAGPASAAAKPSRDLRMARLRHYLERIQRGRALVVR